MQIQQYNATIAPQYARVSANVQTSVAKYNVQAAASKQQDHANPVDEYNPSGEKNEQGEEGSKQVQLMLGMEKTASKFKTAAKAVNNQSQAASGDNGQLMEPTAIKSAMLKLQSMIKAQAEVYGKTDASKMDANKSTKEAAEPCESCSTRTYQDGSNDPGVSFKSATSIAPSAVAGAVMSHEREHVANNKYQADQSGGEVISSSVRLQGGICNDCGKSYIAGGVTETVTASKRQSAYTSSVQAFASQQMAGEGLDIAV